MILRIHQPAYPLDKFIENFVYFDAPRAVHNLDRFLPDGNTEIIIDLSEIPQYIYDNETLQEIQTCRHAWVSGIRTRSITIPSGRGRRMVIVAFKKGGAFPFYPFPMNELTDTVAEADSIFGRALGDLREQLLAAPSIGRMFELLEGFLLRQGGEAIRESTATRCVEYALSELGHDPGRWRLRQLSEQIGYSQKHFTDLFKQQVGVSPKQYLRIMRFQKAVRAIENSQCVRWSEIALASGYYDQAHFIHDFNLFAGFTPNEYLKRKASLLNYVPVD